MPYSDPADQQAWRDEHKEQTAEYCKNWRNIDNRQRRRTLMRFHGITLEQFNELLAKQEGGCAICGKKTSSNGSLSVDHCHERKVIRGVLCTHCNSLLAMADDDLDILKRAVRYLEDSAKATLPWNPKDKTARYWGKMPNGKLKV